jgi:hypothetical protein
MVNWLQPLETNLPLLRSAGGRDYTPSVPQDSVNAPSFIVICPTEVISLLDTLCPLPGLPSTGGWDPFLMSTASAFQSQYARTNTRSRANFDQLRRELSLFSEQSIPSRLPHPGLERWAVLPVDTRQTFDVEGWTATGMPLSMTSVEQSFANQDTTRKAALRLASDYRKSYRHSSRQITEDFAPSVGVRDSLLDLFDYE